MRKQDLILLSPIFKQRETPAEHLGRAYHKTALFDGINGDDYALYWACRSSEALPVKEVAAAIGRRAGRLHKLCAEIEFQLDVNLLRRKPTWAYSLVPFAIGLRTHGDKLTQAEEYLRSIAKILPSLSLPDTNRGELLGWTLEHLGGVLLHRDEAAQALTVYEAAEGEFNKLARSSARPEQRGHWKHHAVACALGTGNAAANLEKPSQALEWTRVLIDELRDLDQRAKQSARSFEYRGHRFRTALGEVLRLQGVASAKLADKNAAASALDESVGVMEETTDDTSRNQLVASYLKRGQSLVTNADAALSDLDTAERLIDRAEETGVYRVFIAKARAQIYQTLDEPRVMLEYAKAALPSARRLGLYRQYDLLQRLIYTGERPRP